MRTLNDVVVTGKETSKFRLVRAKSLFGHGGLQHVYPAPLIPTLRSA